MKKTIQTTIPGFDPKNTHWPQSMSFPNGGDIEIIVPNHGIITISSSEEFPNIVVWSEPGANYLCIEPRFTISNFDEETGHLDIPAGDMLQLSMSIAFKAN